MESILASVLLLAGLSGSPDVQFTQVDRDGSEMGVSYPAGCAHDRCRATFPVDFGAQACIVNAWLDIPNQRPETAKLIFTEGPCTPELVASAPLRSEQTVPLGVDQLGVATRVITIDRSVAPDSGPMDDLTRRSALGALVRVDVIATGAAHR